MMFFTVSTSESTHSASLYYGHCTKARKPLPVFQPKYYEKKTVPLIEPRKRPVVAPASFARLLLTGPLLAAALATACPAYADAFRMGLAAPLSGTFAPLGGQLAEGAHAAAGVKGAELIVADDHCDADGGRQAAENFVRQNVRVVGGFLCPEALEAALPVLTAHNIPVILSDIAEQTLAERRATPPMPVFRLTTGIDKETHATANFLGSLWRAQPFAVIDDGTIEGRERAGPVLARLKEQQLRPVFTDTYRPGLDNQNALVARLRRAGATHVYVSGERDDVAVIGASAAALGYPLEIAGGSLLDAAPGALPLSKGTLMIAPLRPQDLPTAKPAIEALHKAGQMVSAYAIKGYATVEIAADAAKKADAAKQPLADALRANAFDTVLGSIRFDANGMRTDNPNRLQRFDGKRFIPEDK